MFEKINIDIDANYSDRKISRKATVMEMGYSSDCPKRMWFNVQIGEESDDYIIVSFRLDDFFECIGKSIVREYEEDE